MVRISIGKKFLKYHGFDLSLEAVADDKESFFAKLAKHISELNLDMGEIILYEYEWLLKGHPEDISMPNFKINPLPFPAKIVYEIQDFGELVEINFYLEFDDQFKDQFLLWKLSST